jgi:hypothetical protein
MPCSAFNHVVAYLVFVAACLDIDTQTVMEVASILEVLKYEKTLLSSV